MKINYLKRTIGLLSFFIMLTIMACNNISKEPELSKKESDILQKYLDEKVIRPLYNGTVFSTHKLFKNENDTLYIWAYMQEYYKIDDKIELGSGWSVPMEISITESPEGVTVKRLYTPNDGDAYTKGILTFFPEDIQKQVLDFPGTAKVKDLEKICKERAEKFFK